MASERIGLILPASLCSGQVARMAAQRLNSEALRSGSSFTRYVALVHTEGCGGSIQPEYVDTFLGYLSHPSTAACLILEHGCEITHNDFWRQRLARAGIDPRAIGWASVQMDGGIQQTLARIDEWFAAASANMPQAHRITAGLGNARIGMISAGHVDDETAAAAALLAQQIAAAGGTLILPQGDTLLNEPAFVDLLGIAHEQGATLGYAQRLPEPGMHVMANPSSTWSECIAGLGATGVDLILALVVGRAQQGHPFIPVLQVAAADEESLVLRSDIDLVLEGAPQQWLAQLMASVTAALSRDMTPKQNQLDNVAFQITRGQLGVSL